MKRADTRGVEGNEGPDATQGVGSFSSSPEAVGEPCDGGVSGRRGSGFYALHAR
jgi:hypothetical protein